MAHGDLLKLLIVLFSSIGGIYMIFSFTYIFYTAILCPASEYLPVATLDSTEVEMAEESSLKQAGHQSAGTI